MAGPTPAFGARAAASVVVTVLAQVPLQGAGGEPVDFRRTLASHGVAALPPNRIDADDLCLSTTLAVDRQAYTLVLTPGGHDRLRIACLGAEPDEEVRQALLGAVRRMLRLDDDLSGLYARLARDRRLAWAARGAGRLLRAPSVFEDVVKTICTTNCAWAATVRMISALVDHLGTDSGYGRAFPDARTLAEAPLEFYRDVARAGYRGAYIRALAQDVASGRLDLEALRDPALPDVEVERRLLALAGVGPYAAAHIMLIGLGRYRPLILDSWTRPTYARLTGAAADDATIRRRFRRYGAHAGLAFWLYLTRDWVDG